MTAFLVMLGVASIIIALAAAAKVIPDGIANIVQVFAWPAAICFVTYIIYRIKNIGREKK